MAARAIPVSPRERLVAWLVAIQLAALPWAFGGVDLPTQLGSALVGSIALAVALLPIARTRPAASPDSLTWFALALAALVVMQIANPAYAWHVNERDWWLDPLPHHAWLPTGIQVPIARGGPWRSLIEWIGPAAAVLAIRRGVAHRATVYGLLRVVALNGFALASFGFIQRAAGSTAIYGLRSVPSAEIFASFIYRNHAAAYLNLAAAAAMALAVDAYRRPAARAAGVPLLWLLCAITALAGVVLTFSVGGVLLAAVLLVVLAPLSFLRLGTRGTWVPAVGAAGVAAAILLVAAFAGASRLPVEFERKLGNAARGSAQLRLAASRQGLAMLRDRPVFGWGAGSFEFIFSKYQRAVPQLDRVGHSRMRWEHLHNDWLEWLAELGLAGLVAGGLGMFALLRPLATARVWHHPALAWIVGGVGIVAAHATFDFPLHNPAVLTTWLVVLALLPRGRVTAA